MLSLTLAFNDSRKAGAIVTLQGRRWRQPGGRHHRGPKPGPLRCGGTPSPLLWPTALGQGTLTWVPPPSHQARG